MVMSSHNSGIEPANLLPATKSSAYHAEHPTSNHVYSEIFWDLFLWRGVPVVLQERIKKRFQKASRAERRLHIVR